MSHLELRLARYEPGLGAPTDPRRRRTYSAALEQFGELLDASGRVSHLSRPLLLFYALSQAGRAIAAARAIGDWQIQGHGLELPSPSGAPWNHRTIRLKPNRRQTDAFSVVSRVLASSLPTSAITFEAVFATIPELSLFDHLVALPALQFHAQEPSSGVVFAATRVVHGIVAVPPQLMAKEFGTDPRAAASGLLAQYPTTAGWQMPGTPVEERGYRTLHLTWETSTGSSQLHRVRRVDDIAPTYVPEDRRYLLPSLGGSPAPLPTLMSWWLLLFGLSTQARYEPAEWAAVMDVDTSEWAAPLEHALDTALVVLPQLVVEGLSGRRS